MGLLGLLSLYSGEILGADAIGSAVFIFGNVLGADGDDGERAAEHFGVFFLD